MAQKSEKPPRKEGTQLIWLHVKDDPQSPWEAKSRRYLPRIPMVGEHIVLGMKEPMYEITLVVHCAFPEADSDAEVYALKVDTEKAISNAGKRESR